MLDSIQLDVIKNINNNSNPPTIYPCPYHPGNPRIEQEVETLAHLQDSEHSNMKSATKDNENVSNVLALSCRD